MSYGLAEPIYQQSLPQSLASLCRHPDYALQQIDWCAPYWMNWGWTNAIHDLSQPYQGEREEFIEDDSEYGWRAPAYRERMDRDYGLGSGGLALGFLASRALIASQLPHIPSPIRGGFGSRGGALLLGLNGDMIRRLELDQRCAQLYRSSLGSVRYVRHHRGPGVEPHDEVVSDLRGGSTRQIAEYQRLCADWPPISGADTSGASGGGVENSQQQGVVKERRSIVEEVPADPNATSNHTASGRPMVERKRRIYRLPE